MTRLTALTLSTVLLAGLFAYAEQGELALIEIAGWGASRYEPGDTHHVGFLHARTIESESALPPQFKLTFRRAVSHDSPPTPWNSLPARYKRLRIQNGEWIVGRFTQGGDSWEAVPGQTLLRPEDLTPEQLTRMQSEFKTPLLRRWVPDSGILADILERAQWRMSEADFRQAFAGAERGEGDWQLRRQSFRKTITLHYPNTQVLFEFSGVVDDKSDKPTARRSSLIGFRLKHPLKPRPDTSSKQPPDSLHFRYVKQLHDSCVDRFEKESIPHRREDMFHAGTGFGYLFWERIISETAGTFTFSYSDAGGTAKAPQALIAADLKAEKAAASLATVDWPLEECGNDFHHLVLP